MSKKAEPKTYTRVNWPCLQVTVQFTYINGNPYTAQMLERREKRLANVAQSDKTIYTTDTKVGG